MLKLKRFCVSDLAAMKNLKQLGLLAVVR